MSDTLNELSDFEERFWHRLIVNCDDYGRFDARPAVLKGRLFPLMDGKTKKDMTDALNKLASVGLVELYEVDGKPFLHVVTWSKYQRTRATKSKYPSPADNRCQLTTNAPVFECECDIRNSICEGEDDAHAREAAAAVVSAYLDKINPTPSEGTLRELERYAESMGVECCCRAFDIALDEKKTSWSYIRAILRSKLEQGVKCLADWDKLEEQYKKKTQSKKNARIAGVEAGADVQPSPDRIKKNADWLEEFLAGQGVRDD